MIKVIQPGVYYFGDLCYVTDSQVWERMCDHMPNDDGGVDYTDPETGVNLVLNYTKFGDGSYQGRGPAGIGFYEISVDSGSIGIIPIESIPPEKRDMIKFGVRVEIKGATTFTASDGLFQIYGENGIYEVDTGEYEHDELEEGDEEYYDYYHHEEDEDEEGDE